MCARASVCVRGARVSTVWLLRGRAAHSLACVDTRERRDALVCVHRNVRERFFFFSPLDARDVVCNDNGGWQITLTHTLSPVLDPGYNKKSVGSLNILIKLNGAHPRPGLDDELCTFEDKQDHLLRGRHQIHVFFFFFFFFLYPSLSLCCLLLFLKIHLEFFLTRFRVKELKTTTQGCLETKGLRGFVCSSWSTTAPAVSALR